MTIFDWFKLDEKKIGVRLACAIPLLLIGYGISFLPYNTVWRYFSWSNQTLAMIALWAGSVYLATNYGANRNRCWIAVVPATFMSAVSITYFCYAGECLNLKRFADGTTISYIIGIVAAIAFLAVFLCTAYAHPEKSLARQQKDIIARQA